MMLAYRLVKLIETHSEALAESLHTKITTSDKTRDYVNVPADELTRVVHEMYRNLGEWLLGKTEGDIEKRYLAIGARRAEQKIPISQLVWTIMLVKENLFEYIGAKGVMERPAEVFGELEILQLLEQFFDRAVYYAALGHERARAAQSSSSDRG